MKIIIVGGVADAGPKCVALQTHCPWHQERSSMRQIMAVLSLLLVSVCSYAQAQDASKPTGNVLKDKQTSLGLYLTAKDAY